MRARIAMVGTLAALSAMSSCVTRSAEKPAITSVQQSSWTFAQSTDKDVDILFVVDNSGSMESEQRNLARNFPRLIDALRTYKLGPDGSGRPCTENDPSGCAIPNVRIGVISTDIGTAAEGGCPGGGDGAHLLVGKSERECLRPNDPWISYKEGQVNITAAGEDTPAHSIERVKEAFSCIAELGIEGCSYEQPLEAARQALDPTLDRNPGFLRPDALLAVVFITDEDDCSVGRPDFFASRGDLGPADYRCFGLGTRCEHSTDVVAGVQVGALAGCAPADGWLLPVTTASATPSRSYEAFFRSLKPKGRLIMAAIAGPTDHVEVKHEYLPLLGTEAPHLYPSCTRGDNPNDKTEAYPAIRIKALIDAFDAQRGDVEGQFTPICTPDFGPALEQLGSKIVGALGPQCIRAPLLSPTGNLVCAGGESVGGGLRCPNPGCMHIADCYVEHVMLAGTTAEQRVQIERCPAQLFDRPDLTDCGDACPCWRVIHSDQCSPQQNGTPHLFQVLRAEAAPKGALAIVNCQTGVAPWGTPELFKSLDGDGDGMPDDPCRAQ